MTDHHEIDPARAAQITERIGQVFDFVRDAIDDPRILEAIPSGSMLMFRDVLHHGQSLRLAAFLPKHPGAHWGARVSGPMPTASAGSPLLSVAGYDTSDAALDALEAELRTVVRPGWTARRAAGA